MKKYVNEILTTLILKGLVSLKLLTIISFFSHVYGQQKTIGLIKHQERNTQNGYVLFAPLECKTTYLIDKCGRKVHSWISNYQGFSADLLPNGNLLRIGVLKNTFFTKSANGGIIEIMDWDGNMVWSYVISNDSLGQHHDVFALDNGNLLVVAIHVITESKAIAAGRRPGTLGGNVLYSERILELKPKGTNEAEIVWQWNLWDHLIQDENSAKPNYGIIGNHPELLNINFAPAQSADWIHINSIDYNKDRDQILVSCKSLNEIWIIDHSTTTLQAASHAGGNSGKGGDILYRWGNPMSYDKGDVYDQKFFHQHNAHWIPKGYKDGGDIMVFNNGLGRIPNHSSVEIITPGLNAEGTYDEILPYGPSYPKWIYKDPVPENFFSGFKSSASRIANGNTLICSGLSGKFFEVDTNNNIVWEYINPLAPNDRILNEGETGVSVVFKCTHYNDTFSGFKEKKLAPLMPIEKNPSPYFCLSKPIDDNVPLPINFFPIHKAKGVAINAIPLVTFDETIYKGTKGYVRIYENNILKETLFITDNRINISGNTVSIKPSANYKFNSRISISIDKGSFKDFSGNETKAFDTLNWGFKTVK